MDRTHLYQRDWRNPRRRPHPGPKVSNSLYYGEGEAPGPLMRCAATEWRTRLDILSQGEGPASQRVGATVSPLSAPGGRCPVERADSPRLGWAGDPFQHGPDFASPPEGPNIQPDEEQEGPPASKAGSSSSLPPAAFPSPSVQIRFRSELRDTVHVLVSTSAAPGTIRTYGGARKSIAPEVVDRSGSPEVPILSLP